MDNPLRPYSVAAARAVLGESSVWDAQHQRLYFIDIVEQTIRVLTPGKHIATIYRAAAPVGALALTDRHNLIFTEGAGVVLFDTARGLPGKRSDDINCRASMRFNDGACDPQGRFITGLMDERANGKDGALYRFDRGLNAQEMPQNIAFPNGQAWSDDGLTLYLVDSRRCAILRVACSADDVGENTTVFATMPAGLGRPDGIAIDAAGGIWVCQFGGGCLLRYDADGKLSHRIDMPVPCPTSCCFGGKGLMTLFVTTARLTMTPSALAVCPEAGDIYALHPDTGGIARYRFHE